MVDIHALREDYTRASLSLEDLDGDPVSQLQRWLDEAIHARVDEPNAMCLATVNEFGAPSTRVVLLKYLSKKGLVFFTNYNSRKARDIEANANVSANFLWLPLQRQVAIGGKVNRISRADTLSYFLSRPLSSQLGAWSSPQSQVISSRKLLEDNWERMKQKFADGKVPLPDYWGGYRIEPSRIEFWQGRSGRLHDRFEYCLGENNNWSVARLAP